MCGGIFKNYLVANLPLSLPVNNFENRLTFGEVMGKRLVSCFFDSHCRSRPIPPTNLVAIETSDAKV